MNHSNTKQPDVVMSAFTDEQAARLTGLSKSQLVYWDKQDFFKPSFGFENRRSAYSRIYSFRDLVSLKILNNLRNETKVPLQHLREVRRKLAHLGDDIWSKTTLFVLRKKVIFRNPETDELEEIVSSQGVLEIPLQMVSNNMVSSVQEFNKRDVATVGKIERKKGFAHNQETIAGTRIRISSIKSFHEAGYSIDQILSEYPTLTPLDIEFAIKHEMAA